jgi:hypothetical protein
MKPIIETARFPDGRLMLRVRFMRNSNFWIEEEGATWVPTFEELYLMNDALHATNYFNLNNKTLHKANSSSETCDCGHLRSEHFDFIDRIDMRMNRPYRQWVAKGLGKCSKCSCQEFKKTGN